MVSGLVLYMHTIQPFGLPCIISINLTIYYMANGSLLATKTLIESIRYYIRDPSGVFSVCYAREWYIDKFPPFLLLFFQNGRRVQGLWC